MGANESRSSTASPSPDGGQPVELTQVRIAREASEMPHPQTIERGERQGSKPVPQELSKRIVDGLRPATQHEKDFVVELTPKECFVPPNNINVRWYPKHGSLGVDKACTAFGRLLPGDTILSVSLSDDPTTGATLIDSATAWEAVQKEWSSVPMSQTVLLVVRSKRTPHIAMRVHGPSGKRLVAADAAANRDSAEESEKRQRGLECSLEVEHLCCCFGAGLAGIGAGACCLGSSVCCDGDSGSNCCGCCSDDCCGCSCNCD